MCEKQASFLSLVPPSFRITCNQCNRTFNIEFDYLLSKKNVCCPNCELEFPTKALEELKESIDHLNQAIEIISKTKTNTPSKCPQSIYSTLEDEEIPIIDDFFKSEKYKTTFGISIDWESDNRKPSSYSIG